MGDVVATVVTDSGGHVPGEAFRLVSIGFAAFVAGVWLGVSWWQMKTGLWRQLERHDALLGAALLTFVLGFTAIQIEAVWYNPRAVLLWGNLLFPVGLALMLAWLMQLVARLAHRRDER